MSVYDNDLTTEYVSRLFIKQMKHISIKKENTFENQHHDAWIQ